jgi:predicted dehydrogenase
LIDCEGGGITLAPYGALFVATSSGTRREAPAAPEIAWATPPFHVVQESVVAICRHMLGCVRDGRPAETSIDDNMKTSALVEAAYESAASGTSAVPRSVGPGVGARRDASPPCSDPASGVGRATP